MAARSIERHLEFCTTDYQREVIQLHIQGLTQTEISKRLGRNVKRVNALVSRIHIRAAASGVAPDYGVTRQVAPGFTTKRLSTAYGEDGSIKLQWHIQEPEKVKIQEMMDEFTDAFKDELSGIHKPLKAPKTVDQDLMSVYLIGDHHLGLSAWSGETGAEDWDVSKSEKILDDAVDRLVSVSPNSETGCLVNLGDFFHIQDAS